MSKNTVHIRGWIAFGHRSRVTTSHEPEPTGVRDPTNDGEGRGERGGLHEGRRAASLRQTRRRGREEGRDRQTHRIDRQAQTDRDRRSKPPFTCVRTQRRSRRIGRATHTYRDGDIARDSVGGMAAEPPAVALLSPKSSFEMLDYEQRLAAMEQSRLAALHHSTGAALSPSLALFRPPRPPSTTSRVASPRCRSTSPAILSLT